MRSQMTIAPRRQLRISRAPGKTIPTPVAVAARAMLLLTAGAAEPPVGEIPVRPGQG